MSNDNTVEKIKDVPAKLNDQLLTQTMDKAPKALLDIMNKMQKSEDSTTSKHLPNVKLEDSSGPKNSQGFSSGAREGGARAAGGGARAGTETKYPEPYKLRI